MLKTILLTAFACLVALGLGGGSALFAVDRADALGALRIGFWVAYPDAGTVNADPYTRARVARNATLPLGPAEGLVFRRRTDEGGRPLRPQCRYIFEGRLPPAAFWTLHAADMQSGKPILGDDHPGALHSYAMLRQPGGSVRIAIGPTIETGNWLAVEGDRPFRLVLSLYDTPLGSGAFITPVAMPTVTLEGNCDS